MEKCSEFADPVNLLPIELIIKILKNLDSGKEIYRCRRVCKLWHGAVDLIFSSDNDWKKMYEKDYSGLYSQADRKTSVNYESLYKSISLWSQVKSAEVTVKKFIVEPHMLAFQIINKDTIGVTLCDECRAIGISFCIGCNNIGYFDLHTGRMLHSRGMSVERFQEYKENDYFIAVIERDIHAFTMSVRPKLNNQDNICLIETSHNYDHVFLHGNKLYYVGNDDHTIRKITVDENGDFSNQTVCHTDNLPLAFSSSGESIHFVSNISEIFTLSDDGYSFTQGVDSDTDELHTIRKYNLSNTAWKYTKKMKKQKGVYFVYGDVVMYGSHHGLLGIWFAPFANGPFDIHKTEPSVILNLRDMVEFTQRPWILCMDVVEVENGHDIIVMTDGEIVKVEFRHESDGKESEKDNLPKKRKRIESDSETVDLKRNEQIN